MSLRFVRARASLAGALVSLVLALGCEAPSAPVDANAPLTDAARADAGREDAGANVDAFVPADGGVDAGPTDDAATLPDAATIDDTGIDAPLAPVDGGSDAGSDAGPTCPSAAALQRTTDAELARQGIPGVTLGIDMPGCTWISAAGLADRATSRAMSPDDGFRIASITKTFTAAVILQLVEEGRLHLDDHLTTFVAFPGADAVTIRQLLAHTSGIYDYYNSPTVEARLGDPSWTRQTVVDVARAQPLAFAPGSSWAYSNTNYYLLGMIIEAVTGHTYEAEVRARLFDPLGLASTYVAGVEPARGTMAHGYDHTSGSFVDVTDQVNPVLTWAAGGIVSTTPDLMVWTRALFAGDVLMPATRTAMLTLEPLPGGRVAPNGLCPTIQNLPRGIGTFDSHLGRLQGYYGMIGYLPAQDAVMVELTDDHDGAPNPFMTDMWMVVGIL